MAEDTREQMDRELDEALLAALRFEKQVATGTGSDDGKPQRPSPAILNAVIARLKMLGYEAPKGEDSVAEKLARECGITPDTVKMPGVDDGE
jgi:hypothetical protein